MSPPTPQAIEQVAANFARDMPGTSVESEPTSHPGRWRVTVKNDRVRLWVEYVTHSRGRLLLKNSQLFVDDVRIPNEDSYTAVIRRFLNPPDGVGPVAGLDEPADEDMTAVDLADAPDALKQVHRKVAPLATQGFQISVWRGGRYWHLRLENARAQLRVVFVEYLMNHMRPLREVRYGMVRKNPVRVFVDGEDVTSKVNGRIERALAMMTSHTAAPAGPPVAGPAGAAVQTTGVQVRNTVVMRN